MELYHDKKFGHCKGKTQPNETWEKIFSNYVPDKSNIQGL